MTGCRDHGRRSDREPRHATIRRHPGAAPPVRQCRNAMKPACALLALTAVAACADDAAQPIDAAVDAAIDVAIDGATDGRVIDGPGGIDADESPPSRVYAHSGQMLYRIDTTTNAAIPIGPFTNLGTQSMTDIAVDRDERMIGVTLNKICLLYTSPSPRD